VTNAPEHAAPGKKPRPDKAIDARRQTAADKVAAVEKAVKTLGRAGAPITRAGVAQLAGASRSFTYENDKARAMITEAQAEPRPVRRGDKWRGFAELNGGVRATSEGICAGHGVVPVDEGIASGLDPARKPRESPPNKSALYTPTCSPTSNGAPTN